MTSLNEDWKIKIYEIERNFQDIIRVENRRKHQHHQRGIKSHLHPTGTSRVKDFRPMGKSRYARKERRKSSLFVGKANRQNHHRERRGKRNKVLSNVSRFF